MIEIEDSSRCILNTLVQVIGDTIRGVGFRKINLMVNCPRSRNTIVGGVFQFVGDPFDTDHYAALETHQKKPRLVGYCVENLKAAFHSRQIDATALDQLQTTLEARDYQVEFKSDRIAFMDLAFQAVVVQGFSEARLRIDVKRGRKTVHSADLGAVARNEFGFQRFLREIRIDEGAVVLGGGPKLIRFEIPDLSPERTRFST